MVVSFSFTNLGWPSLRSNVSTRPLAHNLRISCTESHPLQTIKILKHGPTFLRGDSLVEEIREALEGTDYEIEHVEYQGPIADLIILHKPTKQRCLVELKVNKVSLTDKRRRFTFRRIHEVDPVIFATDSAPWTYIFAIAGEAGSSRAFQPLVIIPRNSIPAGWWGPVLAPGAYRLPWASLPDDATIIPRDRDRMATDLANWLDKSRETMVGGWTRANLNHIDGRPVVQTEDDERLEPEDVYADEASQDPNILTEAEDGKVGTDYDRGSDGDAGVVDEKEDPSKIFHCFLGQPEALTLLGLCRLR